MRPQSMFAALTIAALTLVPLPAAAQQIGVGVAGLAWDDCGASGVNNKVFACDADTGRSVLIGSFVSPIDQPLFVGVEVVIDLQSHSQVLPDWWQFFNLGTCRRTSLAATFDFSILPGGCADPFGQPAQGGMAGYCSMGPNCVDSRTDPAQSRIKAAGAIAQGHPIEADVEYYAVRLVIDHEKTVGAAACAGCDVGVTLMMNTIKSAEWSGQYVSNYGDPSPGAHGCVTWNSSPVPCGALPVRNATWGQVKSLYR